MMEQVCLPDRNWKKTLETVTLICILPVAVRRHPLRSVITRPRPITAIADVGHCNAANRCGEC